MTQPATRDSALVHPLFWGALAILLANDHWFKHAKVLPAAITGKLSDFAGLIVAPVLLTSIVRARSNVARSLAFALVAGVYAAIKVSPSCAHALEAIAAIAHLSWRIWTDPTDLVALSVLPLAWWLSAHPRTSPMREGLARYVRACALVVGVFACVASELLGDCSVGTAFLFNGTLEARHVRLYGLKVPLDCSRAIEDPATWPGPDGFSLRSCHTLEPREVVLLDRGGREKPYCHPMAARFEAVAIDAGLDEPACDAVLVQSEGLAPVVVTWRDLSPMAFNMTETFGESVDNDHGLVLERAGDRLFIKGTSLLRVLPAGFEPEASGCPLGER